METLREVTTQVTRLSLLDTERYRDIEPTGIVPDG